MAAALFFFAVNRAAKVPFVFDSVVAEARLRSSHPYDAPVSTLPKFLRDLNYDQYRDIRFKDDQTLWRKEGLPFQVKFFQAAGAQDLPVSVSLITPRAVKPATYSPAFFDWGKNQFARPVPADAGYAGFRIHYPINSSDYLDEVAVFLGASYFRAVAQKEVYGASARGLALDTVARHPEEFPRFTKFWLLKPDPGSQSMRLYALLESKSVTGAYSFLITPGAETVMKVKAVLFFRHGVEQVGMAPLTSMFWYGENTSNTFGDIRPEVHDSDGLLMETGKGEWLWRPLSWSPSMQVNTFLDDGPKGFGLLQRDRDFSHYQDLEAKYNLRPSVWVQPVGNWGKGRVVLLQLTPNKEYADNVVAFWQPDARPAAGAPVEFQYDLHWYTENASLPPLGRCVATRIDYQQAALYRQMFLDFSGDQLNALNAASPVSADVRTGAEAVISDLQVRKNEFDNSWRASFFVSVKSSKKPVELQCALYAKEKPLTETWTYTWKP